MTLLKVDRFLFSHKKYLIIWLTSGACKVVHACLLQFLPQSNYGGIKYSKARGAM